MSRRPGLPKAILAEVASRSVYGAGHDDTLPIAHQDGLISAAGACTLPPSVAMMDMVNQVVDFLDEQGAVALNVTSDVQELEQPGCLTISWSAGPSPVDVATVFAFRLGVNNLPLLPTWLALRSHTEFDLRWAQGWGPITRTTPAPPARVRTRTRTYSQQVAGAA